MANRILDDISKDYERSEITALWLHERASDEHILLFAVAEMCPVEQVQSNKIISFDKKRGKDVPVVRTNLSADRTVYAGRIFLDTAHRAIEFYRGQPDGYWILPFLDNDTIRLISQGHLLKEPPHEVPLLIPNDDRGMNSFSASLPQHRTCTRICSYLDSESSVENLFTMDEMKIVNKFSVDTLGVDLIRFPENMGAIHLCFTNPLLREMDERLTDNEQGLIIECYERDQKTVIGCRIELTDIRATGIGFHISHSVTASRFLIPIPCPPEKLRLQLYDPYGDCMDCALCIGGFRSQS